MVEWITNDDTMISNIDWIGNMDDCVYLVSFHGGSEYDRWDDYAAIVYSSRGEAEVAKLALEEIRDEYNAHCTKLYRDKQSAQTNTRKSPDDRIAEAIKIDADSKALINEYIRRAGVFGWSFGSPPSGDDTFQVNELRVLATAFPKE